MILTDLLIIGCGPAGMMAAIYAKRANKNVHIIEKSSPGGRVRSTFQVENYLGFGRVNAEELVNNMVMHLRDLGIEDDYGTVRTVERTDLGFCVKTDDETYCAKALIVASGTRPKPIGCENEKRLLSRGVSYCAVCDGFFYENKPVVVIGGGDSALDESLYLANISSHVTVVHDLDQFTASKGIVEKVMRSPKISIRQGVDIVRFQGEDTLESVVIRKHSDQSEEEIVASGAFIYVGNQPETAFLAGINVTDKQGFIKANTEMATSVPGLFAAGDVTKKDYRLIATAISDGAIAALGAVKYLDSLQPRR
jgi:thioredoxin reductase (NADPH)